MSRQTVSIPLKDFEDFINENQKDWKWVEDIEDDFDLSKGIVDMESVRQRKSDELYFKFKYSRSEHVSMDSRGLANPDPIVGEQVFPVEVKITKYK